jgi:hypothetical protein
MKFDVPSLKRAPVPHPLQEQLHKFNTGYRFDEWSQYRQMRAKEMCQA